MRTSFTNPPTFGSTGMMCPSTWALSVETCERPNHQRRIPRISRVSRMTLMIEKTSLRERFGGADGRTEEGRGRVSVVVGSIVVAISSSLMQGTGATNRARQGDLCGQTREPRVDVRLTRADQCLLSVDHFDISGHAGLEPLARLR